MGYSCLLPSTRVSKAVCAMVKLLVIKQQINARSRNQSCFSKYTSIDVKLGFLSLCKTTRKWVQSNKYPRHDLNGIPTSGYLRPPCSLLLLGITFTLF